MFIGTLSNFTIIYYTQTFDLRYIQLEIVKIIETLKITKLYLNIIFPKIV